MKFNRIFSIVCLGALVLAGCTKEEENENLSKHDSSKAKVTSIAYLADDSSQTQVVFEIDGAAAAAAGATTYTVFLASDMESDVLGNGALYKIVDASDAPVQVKFDKMNYGDAFVPMVRANYPPFIHSDWTFLTEANVRKAVSVGSGMIDIKFDAPAGIKATSTDETVTVSWAAVPFAKSYVLEYKASSASEWEVINDLTERSFVIDGLVELTDYEFRVKANGENGASSYKDGTIKTLPTFKLKDKAHFVEFLETRAAEAAKDNVFTIENDIDLEGYVLPASIASYAGTLDGKGHVIKNMKIQAPVFGELSGTLKDIVIDASCQISATGSFAILVDTNKGTVDKIVNKASFTDACPAGASEGVAIAGIVKLTDGGKVTNCTNEGNITVTCDGVLASPVVAGVAAYQRGGSFTGNKNTGNITVSHNGTSSTSVEGFDRKPFCVMAGVLGILVNSTMDKCNNEGAVKVECSAAGKIGARHYVGGVLGSPEKLSTISNCNNKGAVTVDFSNDGTGKQIWMAGIIGGRNGDFKEQDGCKSVENCVNSGVITLKTDYTGANNYLAGIGGQALIEAPGDLTKEKTAGVIKGCKNEGALKTAGKGKIRVGGISGGAATIEDSENSGDITIEHTGAGYIGGLVGYPTQTAHTVKNSANTGNITISESNKSTDINAGGLFGQGGNTAQNYEGCTANCTITAPSNARAGIIFGTCNTLTKAITCGTADNPFKIGGSVKGVKLTADNMADYYIADAPAVNGVVSIPGKAGTITVVAEFIGK